MALVETGLLVKRRPGGPTLLGCAEDEICLAKRHGHTKFLHLHLTKRQRSGLTTQYFGAWTTSFKRLRTPQAGPWLRGRH